MLKKILKNTALFLIAIFFVIYCYVQIKNIFVETMETENAVVVTLEDTAKLPCYIFRKETLITSDENGIHNFVISEGEKLGKGQKIADIFTSDSQLLIQEEIQEIDSKIKILENSSVEHNFFTLNVSKIDKNIAEMITDFRQNATSGNIPLCIQNKNQFLTTLNKRYLVVNALSGFEDEIERLKTKKASLISQVVYSDKTLRSDESGYFFTDVDGYENTFTIDLVESESFDDIISAVQSEPEKVSKNVVGKIVSDFDWYTVCIVDKEMDIKFSTGKYYSLSYPYSLGVKINSQLKNKITSTGSDKTIFVFTSNNSSDGFNFMRTQTIEATLAEYTGLKIKKEALRIENGEEGVFVLEGNTIVFKRANKIFEKDGYYIIDINDPKNSLSDEEKAKINTPYLEMYDAVVNNGKELYNGKTIG